ncbi:BF3164 family lipoprotein [Flavicella sp.]|uniref:BF3164 family lipoprotein n=1 Tax=Flavicella sp. TaxID=2957742 RepID=UPI00301A8704
MDNLKIYALTLITFLSFFSCKEDSNIVINENIKTFTSFKQKDTIKFKKVVDFKKGVVGKIYIKDSALIIFNLDGKRDFFFYNYFLKNDSLSKGYLPGGKGPGEAIGGMSSGLKNNILWLHDLSLNKILVADIEKKTSNNNKPLFKEYPIENNFYMMEYQDSLNLFGVGYINSLFKVQKVDLFTGKIKKQFGEFKYLPEDKPFSSYKTAYEPFILSKPSDDKIVLIYRFSDIIEIFDSNTTKSIAIHGPEMFYADFNSMSIKSMSIMARNSKTRISFVNCAVTDNYIYALYSGKLFNTKNSNFGMYVFVYDWNGNPIKKLILDREAFSIAVSKNDKDIYIYDPKNGHIMKNKI